MAQSVARHTSPTNRHVACASTRVGTAGGANAYAAEGHRGGGSANGGGGCRSLATIPFFFWEAGWREGRAKALNQ